MIQRMIHSALIVFLALLLVGCPAGGSNSGGDDNPGMNNDGGDGTDNGGTGDENTDGAGDGMDNGDDNADGGETSLLINAATADAVKDELILSGEFGDPTGVVTLNGVTLDVVSWGPAAPKPQQIVCALPRHLHGDIVVQNGQRFSNTVQLTRWDLHMESHTLIDDPGAPGQFNIDISVDLTIRACINNLLPHSGTGFSVLAGVSRDSTAMIEASGTETSPPPTGHTSFSVTAATFQPQMFRIVYPGDVTDPDVDLFTIDGISSYANVEDAGGGGLKLLFTLAGVYNQIQTLDGASTTSPKPTGFGMNTYFDTSLMNQLTFDANFNIVAGSMTAMNNPSSTLMWSGAAAQSPPK